MGRRKLDERELETAMLGVGYLLGGSRKLRWPESETGKFL